MGGRQTTIFLLSRQPLDDHVEFFLLKTVNNSNGSISGHHIRGLGFEYDKHKKNAFEIYLSLIVD